MGTEADELKAEANAQFAKGEFLKAAGTYTKAIKLDPQNAVLFRSVRAHGVMYKRSDGTFVFKLDLASSWLQQSIGGAAQAQEGDEGSRRRGNSDPDSTGLGKRLLSESVRTGGDEPTGRGGFSFPRHRGPLNV